jgi:hypothetical protein
VEHYYVHGILKNLEDAGDGFFGYLERKSTLVVPRREIY